MTYQIYDDHLNSNGARTFGLYSSLIDNLLAPSLCHKSFVRSRDIILIVLVEQCVASIVNCRCRGKTCVKDII